MKRANKQLIDIVNGSSNKYFESVGKNFVRGVGKDFERDVGNTIEWVVAKNLQGDVGKNFERSTRNFAKFSVGFGWVEGRGNIHSQELVVPFCSFL